MNEGETLAASGPFAAVILAAGKGTRMKSDLHKVMHPIAGKPMLVHLMDELARLRPARTIVVLGAGREQVEPLVTDHGGEIVEQATQLGTGHAVLQTKDALAGFEGDIVICPGDTPMIRAETVAKLLERLHEPDRPAAVVAGFRPADPLAYGRIVAGEDGKIEKMVEHKDASAEERAIGLCNGSLMAVRAADLFALLDQVVNKNAQGEYYLPDVVMVARAQGRHSIVIETKAWEVAGINSRAELAEVEKAWQQRRRIVAMAEGATLVDPDTVWFSHDTAVGRDVTIEPNVRFGPGVTIADNVRVRAFSDIEGAIVGTGAEIGPYARLRPGAEIGEGAKVGNFVEIKQAALGPGAKANHLSYIGDATVGAGANIGAGAITCNYDGYFKHRTVIGENAFIGSNSALVAPVKVGRDAIVGAGSPVTHDVADGELRLVRAEQLVKPGWADRFHEAMRRKKAEKE